MPPNTLGKPHGTIEDALFVSTNRIESDDMIHEVSGDILHTKAQAIAHGIAPNEHFDSGLARALREQWPAMAKDFRHFAHQSHPKPREIWMWGGVGCARIFNLMTQEGEHTHGSRPGKATLANVNHCLRRLRHAIESEKITSLAIPALATGVGGLAWKEVKPLIEQHLGDLTIPIFLYSTYHADQAANESTTSLVQPV
jgi:O-acetyl-ADP-ribose deacetylase (regulator of RNase III)